MLKSVLMLISLEILGCASLPPTPRHVQYGVHADINPPGFYGVDSQTKAHVYRPFGDPVMKGGQCLTAQDYKEWSAWVRSVEEIAKTRCH